MRKLMAAWRVDARDARAALSREVGSMMAEVGVGDGLVACSAL